MSLIYGIFGTQFKRAGVVELVDTLALGASALWCAGSSPVPGTTENNAVNRLGYFYYLLLSCYSSPEEES